MAVSVSDPPEPVALVLEAVSKRFHGGGRDVQALQAVSLRVHPGRVTGLIGPDGAGKTTLMRLVAGLLRVDDGRIAVLGLDAVRDVLEIQAAIGYMPQRFGLYEDLSVQENMDLYADLQGVSSAERQVRYPELLHMTGLSPFTARLAGNLSGGMKQKLGLACTLIRAPRLLLLDEPTVGVDPLSRRELWAIVYRLVREQNTSVLLSTAYLDEAERCDEVILLHQGQILGQDTPEHFSARLRGHSFTLELPPGAKKRRWQERLSQHPEVLDTVIQGDRLRLVMVSAAPPSADLLAELDGARISPVPPRFEDSFIAELYSRQAARSGPPSLGLNNAQALDGDGQPVIQVRNLERRFGDFYAVKNISFAVEQGEVFGLLGANGAGKSTTFRMLCGLLPASGGVLQVTGLDLRRAAAAARGHLGYMAQKFSLYGNLSVLQNLRFFSRVYGLPGRRREQQVQWALEQFELAALADVVSSTLPLGYKQRLALACALMHQPQVLFLDEPTSGVDPLARREFWRHINALAEQGVTVLVTTHFLEEAEYCDRLAIMAAGEILTLGAPAEIKAQVRTAQQPDPSLEEAFITLIEQRQGSRQEP
ncbi:MAG: ABC transporter ATP-binding protein [Gammaproteobacteria bacterium]|nr:ABC transporter ATP-binding protein [Gammaproteobacteria bacterium]MCP5425856.1 ABC transporter ATP-binding protein [Gammaproteobacteria bacterium]MCP5458543.1 ABC transporter ATP-binding protein [Gammaproteobacteria bacterium]